MTTIVQKDNPVLRVVATPVATTDFGTPALAKIIASMREALHAQEDGVAIAAPQIGVSLRIFVIAGKAFDLYKRKKKDTIQSNTPSKDLICINPEIIKLSKQTKPLAEGCLSVRYLYGKVQRSVRATISAQDINGNTFTRGGSGLIAQIFQHEIDHLNGILFTDTATDVENIPPEDSDTKKS